MESEQEEDYLIPLQVQYHDDDDDDDNGNDDHDDDNHDDDDEKILSKLILRHLPSP